MKTKEIQVFGTIDQAGSLRLYMDEAKEVFKQNKGCRVAVKFSIVESAASPALRSYYYKVVVPRMKEGFYRTGVRYTDEQTEKEMRKLSPIMWEQEADINTGKYMSRLREIPELSNYELVDHINFIKQKAAEYFNIYIEDPINI